MGGFLINGYAFDKPLSSDNSGFSKWGIGQRGGRSYFVKEFLSPIYPVDESVYTEEKRKKRIALCDEFIAGKQRLYAAIRDASDNHLVVTEQFFRVGAKFYISTEAVTNPILSVADIAKHSFVDRLRLCCIVAHAIAGLHEHRIIHADIKPDNILVIDKGVLIPKIIDFDCSFFEYHAPKLGDELNGDLVYLSPEGFLHIAGESSNLSCKMDVFALGLLFHQYLSGSLPDFDTNEYQYAYEAVLDDQLLNTSGIDNRECQGLISSMLRKEPNERPPMSVVFAALDSLLLTSLERSPAEAAQQTQGSNNYFFSHAGDL